MDVDQRHVEPRRQRPRGARRSRARPRSARAGASFQRPGEAERALVGDLRVVVGEADRRARHRHAEHGERLRAALGEDQERDRGHRQDQQPAHGRRALLDAVPRRPLLADVLAERAVAQERDEEAAAEHRQERREHACAEHVGHSATSASRSMPAEREPLSSTKSPGRRMRRQQLGRGRRRRPRACHSQPRGGRRIARAELADADHDADAEARAGVADLGVPARRVGPELGHVAEHGDRARAAGALDERRERALHRGGIRVVGVVHEHAAAARAPAPARAAARARSSAAPSASPRGGRPARTYAAAAAARLAAWCAARSGTTSSLRPPSTSSTARVPRSPGLPGAGSARRRRARRTSSCARRRGGRDRAAARRRAARRRRRRAARRAARPPRARRPRGRRGTRGARARCS